MCTCTCVQQHNLKSHQQSVLVCVEVVPDPHSPINTKRQTKSKLHSSFLPTIPLLNQKVGVQKYFSLGTSTPRSKDWLLQHWISKCGFIKYNAYLELYKYKPCLERHSTQHIHAYSCTGIASTSPINVSVTLRWHINRKRELFVSQDTVVHVL